MTATPDKSAAKSSKCPDSGQTRGASPKSILLVEKHGLLGVFRVKYVTRCHVYYDLIKKTPV
jgi:hypothetical protein